MKPIQNKTIVITGSSRGIGRSIALKLAEKPNRFVINCVDREDMAQSLVDELHEMGSQAIYCKADVSKYEEVQAMFAAAKKAFGTVDVLVNNAGISVYGQIQDITDDDWYQVYGVNVNGLFHCCKEAVPDMVSQKSGKIVNISSMWGLVGASCESLYASTKGAINAFTKSLAKELSLSGITVNAVAPGVVNTDMIHQLSDEMIEEVKEEIPLGRLSAAEEIASTVAFLLSDDGNYYTGQILSPNGGMVIS